MFAVFSRWRSTGLLAQLQQRKSVFREPRGAKGVDAILRAYGKAIDDAAATGKVGEEG
jgi:hypothetical protein